VSLSVRWQYLKNALFGKLPDDFISVAEGDAEKETIRFAKRMVKPLWKEDKCRQMLLDKCDKLFYKPTSAIAFEFYLPFDLRVERIEDIINFSGHYEDTKLAIAFTFKVVDHYEIKYNPIGRKIFTTKGMIVTAFVFSSVFKPEDIGEEILYFMFISAMNSLNVTLNTYIAATEDIFADQLHDENTSAFIPVQIFSPDLKEIKGVINYLYDNRKDRLSRELSLAEFNEYSRRSSEEKDFYSLIVKHTNKVLARKYLNWGDFRGCVVTIQTYVETYLYDVYVKVSVGKGISNEEAIRKSESLNFSDLVNHWLPKNLGKDMFDTKSKNATPQYAYQYWRYCYRLRNRSTHRGWYPTKSQATLAYDVALNFTGFVEERFQKNSIKYNLKIENSPPAVYRDVTDEIDFEENENPLREKD
jgi:hypothetical protein